MRRKTALPTGSTCPAPLRLCAFALNSGRVLTQKRRDAKTQENNGKLILDSSSDSHGLACHPFQSDSRKLRAVRLNNPL
jgi:hypothetical protein